MKWFVFVSLLSLPLAAEAKACSYCGKMEAIKQTMAKVKPEAMNAKTIDQQDKLVEDAADLLLKVFKENKKLPEADLQRIIPFVGQVIRYDYQNILAGELLDVMEPQLDRFFEYVTKFEKSGVINQKTADEIRVSIGTAESVREDGTDSK